MSILHQQRKLSAATSQTFLWIRASSARASKFECCKFTCTTEGTNKQFNANASLIFFFTSRGNTVLRSSSGVAVCVAHGMSYIDKHMDPSSPCDHSTSCLCPSPKQVCRLIHAPHTPPLAPSPRSRETNRITNTSCTRPSSAHSYLCATHIHSGAHASNKPWERKADGRLSTPRRGRLSPGSLVGSSNC